MSLEIEDFDGEASAGQVGKDTVEDFRIELKRLGMLATNGKRYAARTVQSAVVGGLDPKDPHGAPVPGNGRAGRQDPKQKTSLTVLRPGHSPVLDAATDFLIETV